MINSELNQRTPDAVLRYQERAVATLQWCRKSTRPKGELSPPEMPAMVGTLLPDGNGHSSER
jgi:hypothetical protein